MTYQVLGVDNLYIVNILYLGLPNGQGSVSCGVILLARQLLFMITILLEEWHKLYVGIPYFKFNLTKGCSLVTYAIYTYITTLSLHWPPKYIFFTIL